MYTVKPEYSEIIVYENLKDSKIIETVVRQMLTDKIEDGVVTWFLRNVIEAMPKQKNDPTITGEHRLVRYLSVMHNKIIYVFMDEIGFARLFLKDGQEIEAKQANVQGAENGN